MTGPSLEELLALERRVWRALVDGDGEADAALLAADFLGVYPTGFADRDEHRSQLDAGPSMAAFELDDERLLVLADDAAILSYRARFRRPGRAAGATDEVMYVSSLWCHRDGRWVNVFSQDTPAG